MVECEFDQPEYLGWLQNGFNRYMVECECCTLSGQTHDIDRFNRYMVECEWHKHKSERSSKEGFNRYMVECEWHKHKSERSSKEGFNRYMVECELFFVVKNRATINVLIDTWWNVNSERYFKRLDFTKF